MDSPISVAARLANAPTVIRPEVTGPVDLRHAYAFARGLAGLHPDAARPGHRLVWVRESAYASTVLAAEGESFAVLGRHTSCSVALADDPHVALRHLLVRSLVLPSGSVALRILDLHTDAGFRLADGSRHASVLAEGPVAFSVGDYAVVALPTGAGPLPTELPPSHVTELPLPAMVGAAMPLSLGRLAGGRYAITLARGEHEVTVSVTEDELVRGVVIGRSERTHSEALRRVTESGTSRVHLLLVREGSAIHAYDLASTQGTYVGAARVRRASLPVQGSAMLILGHTSSAVRLAWRAG